MTCKFLKEEILGKYTIPSRELYEVVVEYLLVIASDSDIQKKFIGGGSMMMIELGVDMIADLYTEELMERKELTEEVGASILKIMDEVSNKYFDKKQYDETVWVENALHAHPFWEEKRKEALSILKALNEPYREPTYSL